MIVILEPAPPGIVRCDGASVLIGLVDIPEASQVNSADVHSGDVEHGVLERLDFKPKAGLNPVGRLVVFGEAHDDGVAEETTGRKGTVGTNPKPGSRPR